MLDPLGNSGTKFGIFGLRVAALTYLATLAMPKVILEPLGSKKDKNVPKLYPKIDHFYTKIIW